MPLVIIAGAVETVSPLVAKDVILNSNCDMPETESIMTYPNMINIALSKLLDNAAKFTKQGSITLNLCQEEGKLHFSVSDTGPGIPADKKDYIFERFTKLDSFTQGTGLGLSVARMIAEHLGGTLTLDTEYNQGAKFDLIIPFTPQA
jgi:signal transduction histidine kinase